MSSLQSRAFSALLKWIAAVTWSWVNTAWIWPLWSGLQTCITELHVKNYSVVGILWLLLNIKLMESCWCQPLNSLAKLKLLTTEKLGEGKKAGLLYLKNKQNIWLLLAKYYFKRNSQKLLLLGLMKLQHDRAWLGALLFKLQLGWTWVGRQVCLARYHIW